MLDQKVDWCRVTKLEEDGEEPVYDIVGAATETFLANGIVVHNTYPAYKRFSTRLYVSGGHGHPCGSTNEYGVVKDRAIEYGVIETEKKGSSKVFHYGEETWKTQKSIVESMKQNYELFWDIRDKTLALAVEALA